jgi:hypothetical protein
LFNIAVEPLTLTMPPSANSAPPLTAAALLDKRQPCRETDAVPPTGPATPAAYTAPPIEEPLALTLEFMQTNHGADTAPPTVKASKDADEQLKIADC